MTRILRVSLVTTIALVSMLALTPTPAAARGFGIRGGYFVGGGWGWGPGWYGPGWWGPYGYYYGPTAGHVKISTADKSASVYVDGGYVGTVADMHNFALRPGAHDLAVQAPNGQTLYNQRIEILNGKTTKIHLGS